jgi:hypothetical protein
MPTANEPPAMPTPKREQELRIGVGIREQKGRRRRGEHDQQVDEPPAVLVGPDAENRRTSEPVRIGVPTSRPNCVSFRPSSALI